MDRSPLDPATSYVGPVVDHRGIIRKYSLPVGKAESLRVMSEEYAFFTPALTYLYGQFADKFLVVYADEMQQDVRQHFKRFNRPIFKGLETVTKNADWNHVLWAVKREYWQSLVQFLCSLTLVDRATKTVIRYGLQEFYVADPLALDSTIVLGADVPVLPIAAFGINSNRKKLAFGADVDLRVELPRVISLPPDESMRVFADAYFAGDNPIVQQAAFIKSKQDEEQP